MYFVRVPLQGIPAPKTLSTLGARLEDIAVDKHVFLEDGIACESCVTVDTAGWIPVYAVIVEAKLKLGGIALCAIFTGEWKEFHFFKFTFFDKVSFSLLILNTFFFIFY